jgi:ATP adenylyltransferase
MKYIKAKKNKGCIFCEAKNGKKKHYLVFKSEYSIAMLNIYPYNNGHVMISPLRHIDKPAKLSEKEALDLFKALNTITQALDKILKPHGYNIGMNVSEAAGAGIAGHIHLHIVPRWRADTNFMPVLHDTKVISQSLDELYKKLTKEIKKSAYD